MTKEEAIEYLYNKPIITGNSKEEIAEREFQAICLECIQDCIDEENSPCHHCEHDHCDNCLYSGRIPGYE